MATHIGAVDTVRGPAGPHPLGPKRPLKVQICVSEGERAALTAQARAAGHESVASFIRARTLGPYGDRP